MRTSNAVSIQCDRCRTTFLWKGSVTDRTAFEKQAETAAVIDCPRCHHFVPLDTISMTFLPADAPTEPQAKRP
jgi:hypothetical protein